MSFDEEAAEKPGPKAQWFATTHWSVVLAAGKESSLPANAALEQLCRTYWPPLYAYVRRRGYSTHDAQDLTQGFFAVLLEKNYVGLASRDKGRFRSFLLTALNHFLGDEADRAHAAKRGGGALIISLDEQAGEDLLSSGPGSELTPEKEFQKNWVITLLRQGLERLREESRASGKEDIFEALKAFLEGEANSGEYAAVAVPLGMTANGVAVAVHRLRRKYRELVRAEIAQTVATPEELEDEIRHLFAVLA
jgi:DNA-directed RNA polymerase specialized sigma24 family protein